MSNISKDSEEPEQEEKHVLTHFKKIDESDDYYQPKKTKKGDSITSINNVQIRTLFLFKSNSSADLINYSGEEQNDQSQFTTVVQPGHIDTQSHNSSTQLNNQKNSTQLENLKKMASSEDGYSEATDNIESPDTISTNKPNLPNKQNSSGSDKYNISNVLKHMYTLKYVQRQSVSPDKALEAVTAAAAPPSPFKATSTSKQFWMPDDQVKECFECNDKFTMFNRRHHCRVCGQIFCGKCSDYEIPSQLIWPNSSGNIRACTLCHSFVGQMETGDIKHNTQSIKALMQRLSISSSFYSPFSNNGTTQAAYSTDLSASKDTCGSLTSEQSLPGSLNKVSSSQSLASPSASSISTTITQSLSNLQIANDTANNPFDITENRDYVNSHDLETKQLNVINSSSELRNLWVQIYHTSDGLTFQTRNINKFKRINNCVTGSELVEWLIRSKSVTKDQAIVIGQALVHGKWLECAYRGNVSTNANPIAISFNHRVDHNQTIFYDNNSYYKPGPAALSCCSDKGGEKPKVIQDTEEGPEWIKELNKLITTIEGDPILDKIFNDKDSSANGSSTNISVNDKKEPEENIKIPIIKIDSIAIVSDKNELDLPILPTISIDEPIEQGKSEIVTSTPFLARAPSPVIMRTKCYNSVTDHLQQVHKQAQVDLLKQLLKLKNLNSDWFDVIMPLVWKSVDLVRPDVKHDGDNMDIRKYIKIKKLSGFNKNKSKIVNGLVFTKNVAHKKMNTELKNPTVLLLRSSIEYQRTEEKMCSLEPIFTAETQYLKNYCSKLLLRQRPDILIVEKSVARIAQEIFLQSNVSLILNVKASLMDKLSRFLQADPMFDANDLLRKPKLGFCTNFHVDNVKIASGRVKPLMFFEGTPTNLGCTILLYGMSNSELTVVKSLTKFMIYAAYNSKLEQSFIIDKCADFYIKKTIFDIKGDLPIIDAENEQGSDKELKIRDSNTIQSPSQQNIIKEEISVDQSPLEEVKFDLTPKEIDEVKPENSNKKQESNELKLEICEAYNANNLQNKSKNFKQLLDDILLSVSPFIQFDLPVLLQENREDTMRSFLPINFMKYLKSNILSQDGMTKEPNFQENDLIVSSQKNEKENLHEFLRMHLTKSFDDHNFKRNYADYKSRGGITLMNNPKRLILRHIEKDIVIENTKNSNNTQTLTAIKKNSKMAKDFDCLDVINRQHLAVLFYSQCESSPVFPNICNRPRIIDMKFYCENDMTLGSFLAKNCFRIGYRCNNELCDTLIVFHTRTFAHGNSKITIRMSVVPTTTAITPVASPQQQSMTNASISSSNSNSKSVIHDEKQLFSNLNVNALLSNNSTSNKSNSADSLPTSEQAISKQPASLTPVSTRPESPNLEKEKSDISTASHDQDNQKSIVYDDINIFMWSVCKLCNKSTRKVTMSPDTWSLSMAKFLELTFHAENYRQFNGEPNCCKHSLFQDQYQYFRYRNIVTVFSTSKINLRYVHLPVASINSASFTRSRSEYINEIKDLFEKGLSFYSTLLERITALKSLNLLEKQINKLDQYISTINSDTTLKHKIEKINLLLTNQVHTNIERVLSGDSDLNASIDNLATNDLSKIESEPVNYELIELHLIELRKYIATSICHWNTKMTEFFKKNKFDEQNIAAAEPIKPVQKSKDDEVILGKQISAGSDSNVDLSATILAHQKDVMSKTNSESFTAYSPLPTNPNEDDHSKQNMAMSIGKRLIANLIPSSAFHPLKIPFPEEEHYLLSAESKYYINDKNLSSIVAFTLSSKEYLEFQMFNGKQNVTKETNKDNQSNSNNNIQQAIPQVETEENESSSHIDDKIHFEHQFYDSTTKFYCKVYYPELFAKLRKLILPNDEEKYIHSLFRCMNWDAKGGKSNSQFHKTMDNRFVLKEMSKQEVQSFVEFAPQYVQYITDSIQNKKATALAKIIGAYRICLMKNTSIASKAVKIDVIVLENLFYDKKLTQVFDLKGSERNRMINVTHQQPNEQDIVLLDENFLRWSFDNPIYVKPHTKHVLMKAIENDAQFLSSKFVMDYSLLCGFDEVNNMIFVGIIDYLRVFTWDKKVETYLKTISGQGKMPTIVSPEVYKTRFINAIDRYFLEIPDQWYQK